MAVLPTTLSTAGARSRYATRIVAVALAALLAAALPAAGQEADAPQDYTAIEGLSEPVHEVRQDEARAPMHDGVQLALDITRPTGDGPWPTILELSPYLGVYGDVTPAAFLGPDEQGQPVHLADYFAPRGYAVIHAALRGTGGSTGCLQLLGPTDRADAHELVEWIAAQPWSDGRVGMAGHSYPAMAAVHTAAAAPPSLVTIVASAGAAAMYQHQFHHGVPYNDLVLGPLATYQSLSTADHVVNAADKDPAEAGCAWESSTALNTDHVSGVENDWHRDRDVRDAVTEADVTVFATYGTDDGAVDLQALDWFTGRGDREGDKLWIGQWGHGHVSVGGESYPYPNDREEQWRAAVHAWFDRHLQGRDVETGPPTEVFLNDGQVMVEPSWPVPAAALQLYPHGGSGLNRTMSEDPGTAEVATLRAAPYHPTDATTLQFDTEPVTEPVLLLGTPQLRLRAAIDGARVNLVARLADIDPDGDSRPLHVRGFALNPELRGGLDHVEPVVPGEVMDLQMEGVGIAHRLLPGHRLRLEVTTTGSDSGPADRYLPTVGQVTEVQVHLGGADGSDLVLPVVTEPTLWPDPRTP